MLPWLPKLPWNQIQRNTIILCHGHRGVVQCRRDASHDNKPHVSLDNIFSQENVSRCTADLLTVDPVRSVSWSKAKDLKQAAVLVPLCTVNGEPSVLFTLRSQRLTTYRGQVSFPGGMVDPTDDHRIQTAIRETEEEIGLDPDNVDVWGSMVPVPGRNLDTAVTPILAFCGELDCSKLNVSKDEVSEVFTRSIESLCRPEYNRYTKFRGVSYNYCLPAFTGGQHRIWGLTAVILHQTLTILAPRLYTFKFEFR